MSGSRAKSEPVQLPDSLASRYGMEHLPPNIQHQFGSDICQSLFNDDDAVQRAIDVTLSDSRVNDSTTSSANRSTRRLILDPSSPGFQYESLGAILRTNVVRGSGVTYDKGVTHTDFNAEIHKRRLGLPNTTEYHNRKDDLSKWAEHNILYDRQKKLWDSHKAEKKGSE